MRPLTPIRADSRRRYVRVDGLVPSPRSRVCWRGEFVMANQKTRKCAHIPCLCDVPRGIEYCSDSCRDAGSDDVEIACQCGHTTCPLTIRQFRPRIVADLAN